MAEWEIVNKPLGQCAGNGKVIEADHEYFAALVQTDQGLERRDFSPEYWQQHNPQVYCFWKTRMPRPDRKKKLFIDDDMLMAFFERLTTETEQEKINFRFVLTLAMMRKRILKYDSSRNVDNQEIWTLRVTGQNRNVEVINPNLNEDQIEQLSSQIGQILQVELDE